MKLTNEQIAAREYAKVPLTLTIDIKERYFNSDVQVYDHFLAGAEWAKKSQLKPRPIAELDSEYRGAITIYLKDGTSYGLTITGIIISTMIREQLHATYFFIPPTLDNDTKND